METEGLQRIFNKIGDDLKNKELEFVHDDDNKTHRLIEKNDHIKIKETIDPGHGIQQFFAEKVAQEEIAFPFFEIKKPKEKNKKRYMSSLEINKKEMENDEIM